MNGRVLVLIAATALLALFAHRLRWQLSRPRVLREPRLPETSSEAEQLACLLVTEIKLYNLQEIEAVARGSSQPSQELCADIASARAMYCERVPMDEQANHFDAAVLGILALGNRAVCVKLLDRSG